MNSVILVNEFYDEPKPARAVALQRLCGISLIERHVRTLRKCGAHSVTVVVPNDPVIKQVVIDELRVFDPMITVVQESEAGSYAETDQPDHLLIIAGDHFIEKRFIEYLAEMDGPCLLVDGQRGEDAGDPTRSHCDAIGCAKISSDALRSLFRDGVNRWHDIIDELTKGKSLQRVDIGGLPTYSHAIKRHRRSVWMKITDSRALRSAKNWIIDGAQKGSLDLPAEKLHAPIENFVVSRLCETSITPNQMTLITNIMAWTVTWAILSGYLWPALVGAAVVGIMDGLDGKLARIKMMTSRIGELEHLFDMVFEYSWWLSLGWVLGGSIASSAFLAGVVLVIVNFTDMLIAVMFWFMVGRNHERILDNYTPFDHTVRKISGRRNIYVWLLLLSGPIIGLEAAMWVCVWWGVVTVLVRGGRTLWLFGTRQPPMDFAF